MVKQPRYRATLARGNVAATESTNSRIPCPGPDFGKRGWGQSRQSNRKISINRIAIAPGKPVRFNAATTAAVHQPNNTVVQLSKRDGDNRHSSMAKPAVVATHSGTCSSTTALDSIPGNIIVPSDDFKSSESLDTIRYDSTW